MNFVEPIRDVKKISQIKNMLSGSGDIRTLLMFELGINSALRASDLLRVTVGDVFDRDGTVRDFFEVREKKTGKRGRISITPKVRETLGLYWKAYPHVTDVPSNFLFFAKKTFPLGSKAI